MAPRRITAAEAAGMDLEPVEVPAQPRRRLTSQEAAELDLEPVDEDGGVAPRQTFSPAQTFGVKALSELSIAGVPAVLAAKDALMGEESAKASNTTLDDDPRWRERSLIDRFRKNRDWYKKGMDQSAAENPVANFAGMMAPVLIPGRGPVGGMSLKAMAGRGAVLGAAHGAIGGSADTSGGDIEGTLLDTAGGALAGAGGEVLGAGAGKLLKFVGEKAGKRLQSGITERIKSLLGKYGQRKKDAVQAVKNLALQEGVEQMPQAVAGGKAAQIRQQLSQKFPQAEADLFDASAENAAKQVRRFVGSQKRFGPSAIPSPQYGQRVAERTMTSQANRAIRDLAVAGLRIGLGTAIGNAVLPHFGFSSGESKAIGGALAGGSKLWATRKTAAAIMDHPKMLRAMASRLPALGQRLATAGGNTGAVLGYLTAALATAPGEKALEETGIELAQEAGLDEGVEPISLEDGGSPDGGEGNVYHWNLDEQPAEEPEDLQPTDKMKKKGTGLIPTRVPGMKKPPTKGSL